MVFILLVQAPLCCKTDRRSSILHTAGILTDLAVHKNMIPEVTDACYQNEYISLQEIMEANCHISKESEDAK